MDECPRCDCDLEGKIICPDCGYDLHIHAQFPHEADEVEFPDEE